MSCRKKYIQDLLRHVRKVQNTASRKLVCRWIYAVFGLYHFFYLISYSLEWNESLDKLFSVLLRPPLAQMAKPFTRQG